MKNVVAFVPIKMNNQRCPGKNTRAFQGGDPLISYILKTLKMVEEVEEIYVYCSDEEIIEYLPEGVKFLQRDPSLDLNSTPILEVLKSFAREVPANHYVLAHATAPFLKPSTIREGISKVVSGNHDSAFTVTKCQDFLWSKNGPVNYDRKAIPRTQDLESLYIETTGLYIYQRDLLLKEGRRIGDHPYMIKVDRIQGIDINEEVDFQIAEALFSSKPKGVQLIGIDLDGTLLNDKKEMSEIDRIAIEHAIGKGVCVAIVTGRPLNGVPSSVRDIPGISYIISANGANILRVNDDCTLFSYGFTKEKAKEILEVVKELDVYYDYFTQGKGVTSDKFCSQLEPFMKTKELYEYVKSTRTFYEDFWKQLEQEEEGIEKINLFFKDESLRMYVKGRLEEIPGIRVTSGMPNNLEINTEFISKGMGLLKVAEWLSLEQDKIMAIGDSGNDIPMFQVAGISVAMGNAENEIKDWVDDITKSNEENGVALAIEWYVDKDIA